MLHALNAIDDSVSMHAEHELLPPGELFHRMFVRVVETGAHLANQTGQAVSSHETPMHDEQDAALRHTLPAFLHSLAGYLESCRSVIVCLAPNGKDRERTFSSFRRSIAQYHAHVMMLVNHIKHRHRMLRTVYDLGMSKLSSDTLKMLTDLRKSVLDESTKVADSTRQLVGSVATTLSVGVGLVAAKVGTKADGRVIGAIAVIASAYVAAIVWSGFRAIRLQDAIRLQWKPRTYGFISSDSYTSLVDTPARDAASAYGSIARISLLLTALMLLVVVWSIAAFPGEP